MKYKLYRETAPGRWKGVAIEKYKEIPSNFKKVIREEIVGKNGEKTKFHLRYFELEKGGYTSLEKHQHEHVVIVLYGEGEAIVGNKKFSLTPKDILYIGPWQLHRFINIGETPFGFLCIVDAERDKPQIIEEGERCEL